MKLFYLDLIKYHDKKFIIEKLSNLPTWINCVGFNKDNIKNFSYIVYNNEGGKHTLYATNQLKNNMYIMRLIMLHNGKFGRSRVSHFLKLINI